MLKKFWQSSFYLIIATCLSYILGYGFQLTMLHLLKPADYASMQSLFSLYMVINVPLISIGLALSKYVTHLFAAHEHMAIKQLIQRWLYRVSIIGLCIIVCGVLNHHVLSTYFNITQDKTWILFSVIILFNLQQTVMISALEGQLQAHYVAMLWVVAALFKWLFCTYMVWLQHDLMAVFWGLLLSNICTTCIAACFVFISSFHKYLLHDSPIKNNLHGRIPRTVMLATCNNLAFAILTQVDVMYVNRYFPSNVASTYAACAMLCKLLIYIPSNLVTIIYPMVNLSNVQRQSTTYLLLVSTSLALCLCSIGVLLFSSAPNAMIDLVFQGKYHDAARLLPTMSQALLPYAGITVVSSFLLASCDIMFSCALCLACALVFLCMYMKNLSIVEMLHLITIAGYFVLCIGIIRALKTSVRSFEQRKVKR